MNLFFLLSDWFDLESSNHSVNILICIERWSPINHFFYIYVNAVIGARPSEKGGRTFSRGSVIIRKSVTAIWPLSVTSL